MKDTSYEKRSPARQMMESPNEIFEQALNLDWPWCIDRIGFDDESKTLLVHLDFEKGGTFTCGGCGTAGCKAYDTYRKRWRHLDFFRCRTFLQAPSPRVACPSCGIKQAALPWARRRQRLTLAFEEMVVSLAREMPVRAVSRLVGEHDTRLWRVVNELME